MGMPLEPMHQNCEWCGYACEAAERLLEVIPSPMVDVMLIDMRSRVHRGIARRQ